MPDDYEQLQKRIEDGVRAAEELQRLIAEMKRKDRPKLKLVRGGLVGGAIWAGVEWLRNYKLAVALAATAVTITGATIAEHPASPGADPPPASVRPSTPPRTSVSPPPRRDPVAAPTPRPPRTSPLRTEQPARPTPSLRQVAPSLGATKPPKPEQPTTKPIVSLPVAPTIKTPSVTPVVTTTEACSGVGLLGLCVLG
jgi:hypothetical protein